MHGCAAIDPDRDPLSVPPGIQLPGVRRTASCSGIGAGLALTLGLNTVLTQWAKGNSRDPVILLAGALLLSFVSGVACAIPAWHASKVDPMTALRCE